MIRRTLLRGARRSGDCHAAADADARSSRRPTSKAKHGKKHWAKKHAGKKPVAAGCQGHQQAAVSAGRYEV
jgi:hypothetical protein